MEPSRDLTRSRKRDHLDIALESDISSHWTSNGFDDYEFVHQALPEMDLASVDTSINLFGRRLAAPLLISSMVGGIEEAAPINRNLAIAAQAMGLGMGVGSQRCGIERPEVACTYRVRDVAPDILLFANLGAVQLKNGFSVEHCRRAVEMIEADCLVLHLNPLQEALQPEGNTNFSGLLKRIERVCHALEVPVIIKEVGYGISEEVARRLVQAGVSGIDVAGAGGTSFSRIERLRSSGSACISDPFASWGIRTADSVCMVRRAAPALPLIASGGIRSGVDVAKSIALGADAAGIGGPLLKAAASSDDEVVGCLEEIVKQLRISMFCTGASTIANLRATPLLRRR